MIFMVFTLLLVWTVGVEDEFFGWCLFAAGFELLLEFLLFASLISIP